MRKLIEQDLLDFRAVKGVMSLVERLRPDWTGCGYGMT